MFNEFCKYFKIENIDSKIINEKYNYNDHMKNTAGFQELMSCFQETQFGKGEYRLHNIKEIQKWNEIVSIAFPEIRGKIECFGSDWLGRQFATYYETKECEKVLIFEPGTGYILEIPGDFENFHNNVLMNNYNACVAIDFFERWLKENKKILLTQCVGYKVPLFLGGDDNIENLELIDMEVYWYISAQLIAKIK